jgi:hypothetical protein
VKKEMWSLLGESVQESKLSIEELYDNLAQRVFLPEVETDSEKLVDYYISRENIVTKRFGYLSSMAEGSRADIDFIDKTTERMGLYERLLWNKLVHPPRNVFVIVGGVGCGKTMSVKFITGITENIPSHCEKCQERESLCQGKRLHILMDFNEIQYKYEQDFDSAYREFISDLSIRMSSNLSDTLELTDEFQFVGFWNNEIEKQHREGGLRYAFAIIVKEMYKRAGKGWKELADNAAIAIRKEVFEVIEEDPTLFLDYQCRLWRYVLEMIYGGRRCCVFIVLDNIDCASQALQTVVREVLISHQNRFGNTFVVCLRPETALSKPEGIAGNIIDFEPHCGPDPFDVVVDRLSRFVNNPDEFLKPEELAPDLENRILDLSKEIHKCLIDRKSRRIIRKFAESLVGTNIRNALIIATNLLKLRKEEHDFGPHEINRSLISLPFERYARSIKNPIENVFHVEGAPEGRLLVKPRILRFIRLGNKNTRNISEILTMLGSFGYGPKLICSACNEMMEPAHQLLYSNGKAKYSLDAFLSSENDLIMLTYAGIGYSEQLIYNLNYISMIMPDCVVESSGFPVLSGHRLLSRFRAEIWFLKYLNKIDSEETSELKSKYGISMYFENFGGTLMTWEIIKGVCESMGHLLLYLEVQRPEFIDNAELTIQMADVYKDIASLMNSSAQINEDVLGLKISDYDIPLPGSDKLRNELDLDAMIH